MNISKEAIYNVFHLVQDQLPEKEWIWEVGFTNPDRVWTHVDVQDFVNTFSEYDEFTYFTHEETLHVKPIQGTITLEVVGLPNISMYCAMEDFQEVPHSWFEEDILIQQAIDKHYNLNMLSTLKQKKEITLDEKDLEWKPLSKNYMNKKIIGFKHTSGISFVAEIMKENTEPYTTMKDALLAHQSFTVQFKVVMTSQIDVKNKVDDMIRYMMFFYQEMQHDFFPMTIEEQKLIFNKYSKLILSARELSRYELNNPTPYFLAPKPVTLDQKNLIDPDTAVGVTSILKNYAVTDKADGERMLFFVDDLGDCYLINNVYQAMKTGIQTTSNALYKSLFDGEYIIKHNEFAVFDVYYIGGENVMKLPLMTPDNKPSRYAKMEHALDSTFWNTKESSMELVLKKHVHAEGKEMFNACKKILEDKSRDYNIDGLVFTPIDLPVFGYYPNQYKKIKGKSVAWDKVFKWKPPEQNTIDFLVKEQEGFYFNEKTQKKYKRYKLFTGYNATQWEDISVWNGMQRIYQRGRAQEKEDEYQAKLFKPIEFYHPSVSMAAIPVEASGVAYTSEKEPIEDNTIVEMSYDAQEGWVPLRIRQDKTKLLRTSGKITKTANDLSVALNIWHSIHYPVKVEHIIGQETVPGSSIPIDIEERMLGTNDVYYARDIPRNHMLSVHMLNFHNHGIKSMLYSHPPNRDMLLELACGMAGDLPRWRDNQYNFILGVDLVKNNIESANGSYARFLNQRDEYIKRNQRGQQRIYYPNAVFVIGDCALPLESGEAAKGKDYDSEVLLKLLYQGKVIEKYNFLNNYRITGKASRKFDVVSCQFAIHYFFKTKDRLEGFLRNVSFNLKPQGRFIATFMDGQRVHKLIQKAGKAEGKKENNTVWAIQKQYGAFTKANPYGKLIDVFLENTNHFIPEFLVHFEVLREKAREFQLEVVDEGFFEATFYNLLQKIQNNDPNRNAYLDRDILSLKDDPVQTQFSFLNRWVIFRKMDASEMVA
jgi:hypothetical protein